MNPSRVEQRMSLWGNSDSDDGGSTSGKFTYTKELVPAGSLKGVEERGDRKQRKTEAGKA